MTDVCSHGVPFHGGSYNLNCPRCLELRTADRIEGGDAREWPTEDGGLGGVIVSRNSWPLLSSSRPLGAKDSPEEARYEMIGYVQWALEHRPDAFTPASKEALELSVGRGLSIRKAAVEAGCTWYAFSGRLRVAHRTLRIVLQAEARVDGKRPSEVRRGKNRGRAKL